MADTIKYHYTKTRAQRARTFVSMGSMCIVYILGMKFYEHWKDTLVAEPTRSIAIWVFSLSAVILFLIALWHKRHPATFEAIVSTNRLKILYPGSEKWSFDVALKDIKRFEYRKVVSHAGHGETDHGILMVDGTFHHISMNYDLSIKTLYKEVNKLRPDIQFPKTVNKKIEGLLEKDYKS